MPQKTQDFLQTRKIMKDYLVMLSVPVIAAVFNYGITAAFLVLLSIITCVICKKLGEFFLKTDFASRDYSAVVIGISVSLLLPITAPWWMIVLTASFAYLVCVMPFGSSDNSPFVPAAAAICFASLCWSDQLFNYSQVGDSLAKMLLQGNSIGENIASIINVLAGNTPSAIGTGCIFALFGTLAYLTIRRTKDSIPTYTFILAVSIMALLFPRISSGRFISLVMELCSGMILFAAIFFMSYPSIMPKRIISRVLWGFVSGIICMLIRYASPIEESAPFGILIACAISDFFDKLPLTKKEKVSVTEEVTTDTNNEVIETPVITVVPEEILNEIPDVEITETSTESDEVDEGSTEEITTEAESLEAVISEENTITETEAPFITGGESDE